MLKRKKMLPQSKDTMERERIKKLSAELKKVKTELQICEKKRQQQGIFFEKQLQKISGQVYKQALEVFADYWAHAIAKKKSLTKTVVDFENRFVKAFSAAKKTVHAKPKKKPVRKIGKSKR